MPSKKPSPAPSTAAKTTTQPVDRKNASPTAPYPRAQPNNRWQRSKRYGWDGR